MTEKEEQLAKLIADIENDRIVLCVILQTSGVGLALFLLYIMCINLNDYNILLISVIFTFVFYLFSLYSIFFRDRPKNINIDDYKLIEMRYRFAFRQVLHSYMSLFMIVSMFIVLPTKLPYPENALFFSSIYLVIIVTSAFISLRYHLASLRSKKQDI